MAAREISIASNVPQWAVSGLLYGDWSGCPMKKRVQAMLYANGLSRDGWKMLAPKDDTENELCDKPALGEPSATVDVVIVREVENG